MEAKRTIEFIRVFGLAILATMMAGLDFWLLYRSDLFRSFYALEQHFLYLVVVVFGLTATLVPDEVADWSGRYGWTRQSFRVLPAEAVRWAGFGILVIVTWKLL
jgi:uncharacterized membrane protein